MSKSANFWSPLALWKVFVVFVVCIVVVQLIGVALREGLGLSFITPAGGGAGGAVLGLFVVRALASKAQADQGRGNSENT